MQKPIARKLDNFAYPAVGYCIYCGATEKLGREHILPYGLSGTATLPASSCVACAAITGAVEAKILRGSFWPLRVYRDLKSRTKHRDAPSMLEVEILRKDRWVVEARPLNDVPVLLHFPIYPPPRCLSGDAPRMGIDVEGLVTIGFGITAESFGGTGGSPAIRVPDSNRPYEFARMLAKIAYAYACAEGALEDIEGAPFVLPAILGHQNDVGHWVGTVTDPLQAHAGVLHRLVIHRDTERQLLCVEVQLFADSSAPAYGVVLGRLKTGLAKPTLP